jgi:hypothetical protein
LRSKAAVKSNTKEGKGTGNVQQPSHASYTRNGAR